MAERRILSSGSIATMDTYISSSSSAAESSPSAASPLTDSPLSTPETYDLEDAPTLHGLGPYSSTSDPTFVLVIGGLGFIGSHTVLELLRAGYNGKELVILQHGRLDARETT